MSNFGCSSEMMNNMSGDENVDLPEVDGAGDDSQDSDEEKNAGSGVRNVVITGFWKRKITSLQDSVIERIPELTALKSDTIFTSYNPFFNLFAFLKVSLRVDM